MNGEQLNVEEYTFNAESAVSIALTAFTKYGEAKITTT